MTHSGDEPTAPAPSRSWSEPAVSTGDVFAESSDLHEAGGYQPEGQQFGGAAAAEGTPAGPVGDAGFGGSTERGDDDGHASAGDRGVTGDQDSATDKAAAVAQSAAQSGSDVARAASRAKDVVGEAGRQARDLAGEAREQVSAQADTQKQNAVTQLRALGDELHSMADRGSNSSDGSGGLATEVAHQAAGRVHDFAGWLDDRQPGDLLNGVRDFARRRPGAFLVGALAAGVVAGRLTRNLTSSTAGTTEKDNAAGDERDHARRISDAGQTPSTVSPTATERQDPYATGLTASDDVEQPAPGIETRVRP